MFSRRYIKSTNGSNITSGVDWLDTGNTYNSKFKDFSIFEEYAQGISEDKEWKTIFMNMANGKFIHGISYQNGVLRYRRGNNILTIDIDQGVDNIIDFIKSTTTISSSQDREISKNSFKEAHSERELVNASWGKIKYPEARCALVCDYTHILKCKYGLSEYERKELVSLIHTGLLNENIQNYNIHMYDGYIEKITNLKMGTHNFYIDDSLNEEVDIPKKSKIINKSGKYKRTIKSNKILEDCGYNSICYQESRLTKKDKTFDVVWSSYLKEVYKKRHGKHVNKFSKYTTSRSYTSLTPKNLVY
uniref:Uncharacterized protein n=1 Tax=Pithovirus LCPAC101 TaxID=2506586 RepID=A0A481Z429_9VIRU|nr:MAG: uncharacterized protein LCPAC101_00810 [Pithovirus LCPAC101]